MIGRTKQLEAGQVVRLAELAFGYEVTLLPADQPGLTVLESTAEYVLIEDTGAGVRTRIPLHLIHAVAAPELAPAPVAAVVAVVPTPVEVVQPAA